MNYVHLHGRLTDDPDMKKVQTLGDKPLTRTRFIVAVNEYQHETQFIDCSAMGTRAEAIIKHLKKGSEVVVSGRLFMKTEKQSDGTWKKYAEVVVAHVDFVGSRTEAKPSPVIAVDA